MNALVKSILCVLGGAVFAVAGANLLIQLTGDGSPNAFAVAAVSYIAMWIGGGIGFSNAVFACFAREWKINRAMLFFVAGALINLFVALFILPGQSWGELAAMIALGGWTGFGSWLGYSLARVKKPTR